jgi:hypothetical protein
MPIGQREFHRFLSIGEKISARKAILGSFSVAHLTEYFDGSRYRIPSEPSLDFFYGSERNQFWDWYKLYLDQSVDPRNRESILDSLADNKIAITDLISSCERKKFSALDSSLTNIDWNVAGITRLLESDVATFLCTSKWVLQKLKANVLKKAGYFSNKIESNRVQMHLFPFLADSFNLKPVVEVYDVDDKQIVVIALPTPGGGTFRKLNAYGYDPTLKLAAREFLNLYLESSFRYFKTC